MADTSIEWTDKVWNPVVGCTKISAGCKNCYAKTLHDQRHKAFHDGKKMPAQYAHPFEVVQLMPDRLRDPLSWRKPQRVFVNSVSDLFHEDVPDGFLCDVFKVMGQAKRHTFQVLTKRAERMQKFMREQTNAHAIRMLEEPDFWVQWPYPNVWLGVSVENQAAADERIPHLLATPAAVRFLSSEPLLGPVDLERIVHPLSAAFPECRATFNCMTLAARGEGEVYGKKKPSGIVETGKIGWVIVGGESGHGSRPMQIEWARSIQNQCDAAGVPWFMKQAGANPWDWTRGDAPNHEPPELQQLRLKDKKGGDLAELPSALRVREFPTVPA